MNTIIAIKRLIKPVPLNVDQLVINDKFALRLFEIGL